MILLAMALAYVGVFFGFNCLEYHAFFYDDFDLAIHDQIIWNILHGRLFNSILGCNFLGNHTHFISFLVAPFYALVPHPLFLLFLQTVFLAGGVWPLYLLARLFLDEAPSLAVCLVYLLFPGLAYTNVYEFHPTCFVPFFILYAAYYFFTEDFLLFNIFMLLSLLCQENIAMIFIMWGLYALTLKKPWRWVIWPSGLALSYFLLSVYVFLPHFNRNTFNFFEIYGSLGSSLGQVALTCLAHPLKVLAIMFEPYKLKFLAHLFLSTFFLPLLSPLALIPDLLIFVQHLLSIRTSEISLHYHYTAELIPFIFVALIFGFRKVIRWTGAPLWISALLVINACVVAVALGPFKAMVKDLRVAAVDQNISQKQKLLEEIPDKAPVIATFEFLPHLSHRQYLYSFHNVYTGFYTFFGKKFLLPGNVHYALVNFNDGLTFGGFYNLKRYANLEKFFGKGGWGAVDVADSIVLFKKGVADKFPLFHAGNRPAAAAHPEDVTVGHAIRLYGYDVLPMAGKLKVVFHWQVIRPEKKDINMSVQFLDKDGNIIGSQIRPLCYRIWPTQAWIPGSFIEDNQYIPMTPLLKNNLKSLKIRFFDFRSLKTIPISHSDGSSAVKIRVSP